MFKHRRRSVPNAAPTVENTAARLAAALAVEGPNDDRIGHRRTYDGNTDPAKRGLAVGSAPRAAVETPVHLLRWRACGR